MKPSSSRGIFNITGEDKDWREEYQVYPEDQIYKAGQVEDPQEKPTADRKDRPYIAYTTPQAAGGKEILVGTIKSVTLTSNLSTFRVEKTDPSLIQADHENE